MALMLCGQLEPSFLVISSNSSPHLWDSLKVLALPQVNTIRLLTISDGVYFLLSTYARSLSASMDNHRTVRTETSEAIAMHNVTD